MNPMSPSETQGRNERLKEPRQIPPSIIDRMTHELANQLSVICLGCCELRNSVTERLEADQLREFKRIEIAVQGAVETIRKLQATLQDYERMLNAKELKREEQKIAWLPP